MPVAPRCWGAPCPLEPALGGLYFTFVMFIVLVVVAACRVGWLRALGVGWAWFWGALHGRKCFLRLFVVPPCPRPVSALPHWSGACVSVALHCHLLCVSCRLSACRVLRLTAQGRESVIVGRDGVPVCAWRSTKDHNSPQSPSAMPEAAHPLPLHRLLPFS